MGDNELTVEEARELKGHLERDVQKLIHEFTKATGFMIDFVTVERVLTLGGDSSKVTIQVILP